MTGETTQLTTHTLDVPRATLTYDVRRDDASTEPTLLLIGSPMGAGGFGGDHGGFLGDEYGQPGKPDAFAARLREVS